LKWHDLAPGWVTDPAPSVCSIPRVEHDERCHIAVAMPYEISYALIPFFFSMGAGYFAGKVSKGKMALASINTMLVDYALPFALFVYTAKMQSGSFSSHILLVVVLVVVMLLPYFLSLLLSRFLFHVDLPHAAVRAVTVGMPNFAAIGLPLLHAVYGEQSDLTVALAITTASVVMSPAALILLEHSRIRTDETNTDAGKYSQLLKGLLKTFVKPVVLAPIAGISLSLAGWSLPALLTQSLNIIGGTTAGLALFSTGLILAAQPFRLCAEVWAGVALSNVLQPLVALLLVSVLSLPNLIAGEAILLSAIPCGSFGILFGLSYNARDTTAGTTLVVSSILSAVTLSLTILLLKHF
jgi:malonate transporter and related proteins